MMKKYFIICCVVLLLAACGLENYPGGDLPTQARLNSVKTGDRKEKVLRVLGAPATENVTLNDGSSFLVYAQNLKTSRAFFDPKEEKRDVYVYYFNRDEVLTEQKHMTLEDKKNVSYDSSQTDIEGNELSFFEQIVQNFGRYNTGSQDSSVRR